MWNKHYALRIGLMLIVFASFAQSKIPNNVVFDPLFWRSELKLKQEQVHKIDEINMGFYSRILNARDQAGINLDELTRERSEQIWNTFSAKQRKRWKRLEAGYENDRAFTFFRDKKRQSEPQWAKVKSSRAGS
jgi:hypothetical protein